MTSRDFCYWLQGFFEIVNPKTVSEEELIKIKNHLAMVFKHEIDPSLGKPDYVEKLRKVGHDAINYYEPPKMNC